MSASGTLCSDSGVCQLELCDVTLYYVSFKSEFYVNLRLFSQLWSSGTSFMLTIALENVEEELKMPNFRDVVIGWVILLLHIVLLAGQMSVHLTCVIVQAERRDFRKKNSRLIGIQHTQ